MPSYQIVEKDSYATDWALVRYNERALSRFESKEEANKIAIDYITDRNCNNALTPSEKASQFECYISTEDGVFLGILDGKKWYLTYPKNIAGKDANGDVVTLHGKGDVVKDTKFFLLEGKTVVDVRPIPGT